MVVGTAHKCARAARAWHTDVLFTGASGTIVSDFSTRGARVAASSMWLVRRIRFRGAGRRSRVGSLGGDGTRRDVTISRMANTSSAVSWFGVLLGREVRQSRHRVGWDDVYGTDNLPATALEPEPPTSSTRRSCAGLGGLGVTRGWRAGHQPQLATRRRYATRSRWQQLGADRWSPCHNQPYNGRGNGNPTAGSVRFIPRRVPGRYSHLASS